MDFNPKAGDQFSSRQGRRTYTVLDRAGDCVRVSAEPRPGWVSPVWINIRHLLSAIDSPSTISQVRQGEG